MMRTCSSCSGAGGESGAQASRHWRTLAWRCRPQPVAARTGGRCPARRRHCRGAVCCGRCCGLGGGVSGALGSASCPASLLARLFAGTCDREPVPSDENPGRDISRLSRHVCSIDITSRQSGAEHLSRPLSLAGEPLDLFQENIPRLIQLTRPLVVPHPHSNRLTAPG